MNLVSFDWSRLLIIPVYNEGQKFSCDDHRGISLTYIVSKIIDLNNPHRSQAGFRPGDGCVDKIFALCQILEHGLTHRLPTMFVIPELKPAFGSVDQEVLCQCFLLEGAPKRYIDLVQALYSNTTSQVGTYGGVIGVGNSKCCLSGLFAFPIFI